MPKRLVNEMIYSRSRKTCTVKNRRVSVSVCEGDGRSLLPLLSSVVVGSRP